ncbi:MAG: DEAD/DEAH box helicase [Actinomycetota bacterium]|nr:DEAD/DEAH box helicase [Actinomycetota bacterium]
MKKAPRFSAMASAWFEATFDQPTPSQVDGWASIGAGHDTLIHAPTGSGKTLAAFMWAIDHLAGAPSPPERERCRVLYISPMKALAYDIDRNLRAPLTGIASEAIRLGLEPPSLSVGMRTGDTPQSERQAMLRHPPDILITTPESLFLMLTSRAREILASVETVIVDEVHAIAGTKRGTHLALSLERLEQITAGHVQRIGLSATQRPLDTIAEFLSGGTTEAGAWVPRPVRIVDAPSNKDLDIEIVVPVSDMTRPDIDAPDQEDPRRRSIWPAMYPRLVTLLNEHHSTIFFVNSRSLAERTAAEINRLAGDEVVQAHHGSVSREKRLAIEDRLKSGELKGVVATSTLELGIDMAAVDLVVLVESPGSVASGLQRVGRAGHQVGAASVAKVFPKHRGDLLEATVVVERMYAGDIEPTTVPQNPLDVLAQHLVAMASVEDLDVDETFALVQGAAPYRSLTRDAFDAVLDMLSGRYPSDDFAELRPRIVWDRATGSITGRSNAKLLATVNAGTIPDRGLYTVNLPDGGRVGELDEEMVYESRPGDIFVLGSTSWRIDEITHDRVIVTPAPGSSAASMPFWHGEGPGRPVALGRAIGSFTRVIGAMDRSEATAALERDYRLDPWAADNLSAFVADELNATGALPTDKTIVIERFRDEIGDWRVVVLSPFGSRVHAPWALAARKRLRQDMGAGVDVIWSDDGIMFRFPDVDEAPDTSLVFVDPIDIEDTVVSEVADSALFTSKFRESAARALLLPRRRPGTRTPLWLQRRKAANLLEATKDFGSFPIVLETYREILKDHFDLPALTELLSDIEKRTIRVVEVDVDSPSPFATSLMFDFVASFMYEYDAPIAERRAAALTLDRSLLADLLGEPEFRDLLDADVIASIEADLQHLSKDRKIGSADALHDTLRMIGPLSVTEIQARLKDSEHAGRWLEDLVRSGRVFMRKVGNSERAVAVEDLARLRDAIGVQPPPGVASTFLEPVSDPLGDVVGRFARTHGPFTTAEVASALGLPEAPTREILKRLELTGKISAGAFRPGGTEHEWVSSEVLKRIRRRSLAALRQQVEAVEPSSFARFLPGWQGIGRTRKLALDATVSQLAGASIPASVFESDILAARASDHERALDAALASGDLVWVGREAVGTRDGKISIYPRASYAALNSPKSAEEPVSERHTSILDHLSGAGASFFPDIYTATGGGDPTDVVNAIWDLVWDGTVTNDSFAAVRAYTKKRRLAPRKGQLASATPAHAAGRWYLTASLRTDQPSGEEAAIAIANQLLDRYGVVVRDAVLAEGIPGGFSGLYPVLSSLEDIGKNRRGYFIEGMGGAQFGLPGAIDRLRITDETALVVLAACDPANAYGAIIPWPDGPGRPTRRAGARVAILDGQLIAWMDAAGKRTLVYTDNLEHAARALRELAQRHGKASILEIDGEAAHDHHLAPSLRDAGFTPGYKGFTVGANRDKAETNRARPHRRTPH